MSKKKKKKDAALAQKARNIDLDKVIAYYRAIVEKEEEINEKRNDKK